MRKNKIVLLAVGFWLLGLGLKAQQINVLPEQKEGFYLFFKSRPVNYEALGSEKIGVVLLSADECEKKIFKKARENYPAANGLIFKDLNFCECEVVKIEN